jgi:excisionase family DNA binding protein
MMHDPNDGVAKAACTVKEAQAMLGLSRRQIYRLIENNTLNCLGKFGRQHLILKESIDRAVQCPLMAQPVPRSLQRFFPEYDLKDLNAGKDRVVIALRLLEDGGLKELRWLEGRYGNRVLGNILVQYGDRQLSARAKRFWSLYFRVQFTQQSKPWQLFVGPWEKRHVGMA